MPFERPTLREIVDRIESDLRTRIIGADTFLRRSILKVLARVYGGAIHLLYGNIDFNKDQLFASTSDAEYLVTHASEYGISRTASTKATGSATVTGTTGTTIPAGTEVQSTTGQVYVVDSAVVLVAGTGTIALTAKEAGADGNDDGGITLSFVSPIVGVDSTCTVTTAGLDSGTNQETDAELRDRVLTRKRQPPHGGADFDYEEWMKEVSGVTRAWAISQYQGIGTIGCAFVRDGDTSIIPSESEIEIVRDYIVSHADPITGLTVGIPATAEAGLFMIDLELLSVNLTLNIYPNTTAVQEAIEAKIEELILEIGGPEQTIYLSQLNAVISAATGEERHEIEFPTTDITATASQVHTLGTITWGTYNG